jgi:diguanylate cyclase (GGDEF)-like protein
VTICDIDQFKPVNDHNGHAIGDLVLSEVTRILSHHGVAGRLGGDEFVLLAAVPAPTRSPWQTSSTRSAKRSPAAASKDGEPRPRSGPGREPLIR